MGFASVREVWVGPMEREWRLFVSLVSFWFLTQYFSGAILRRIIPGSSLFSPSDQTDLKVRACSVLNGLFMSGSLMLFLWNLYMLSFKLPDDLYEPMPFAVFSFFRVAIVAYFTWDVVVCFLHGWSWAWKLHGICSLIGVYCLWFPYADAYAGFYTGCFEISNVFYHVSIIFRMIAAHKSHPALSKAWEKYAAWCEYIFAFLFFVIRCVCGSFLTYSLVTVALRNLYHDILSRHKHDYVPQVHDELACVLSTLSVCVIQAIQYYWLFQIIQRAQDIFCAHKKKSKKDIHS